jgi:glyoxylase-like metal-dependent hydrolase (beta-lactamase superfamily II)
MFDNNETNHLKQYIAENNLQPQGIINTHAHIDHIFGAQAMIDAYHLSFGIHQKEDIILQNAQRSAAMFGIDMPGRPKASHFISEGKLELGNDILEVRFTPGHSPGSISFYYADGKWVLSGDVLFNNSIGRTDLPGGNFDTLISSIRTQLFTLPDDTTVYSGHGPATTIGHEKHYNPFLN